MTAGPHDTHLLGAYVLNTLDPDERRGVDAHLAGCEACRSDVAALEAVRDVLDDIPPEAMLHGPPDADLVLQKTLRQVRTESAASARRRWMPATAAAAAVLAAAIGGGIALGRETAPSTSAGPGPSATASASTNGRAATIVDPNTKVRMTARLAPAAGWVRINASVNGIPAGEDCRLLVVTKDGRREVAGGWIVSPNGEKEGTNLDGSAAVAPSDVVAVEVRNTAGKTFVTLPI